MRPPEGGLNGIDVAKKIVKDAGGGAVLWGFRWFVAVYVMWLQVACVVVGDDFVYWGVENFKHAVLLMPWCAGCAWRLLSLCFDLNGL